MATIKNVNINGTVSKLSAGVYDVSEQNSGKHYSSISEVLSNADTDIPSNDRFPGMQIKFIQTTPAKYTVVKTEGVAEQPVGTVIQSNPGVDSGTYEESQLNIAFSLLPDILNSSITYYLTVTETVDEQEVTTYTTWKITLVQSSDNKYMQYRLMTTDWSTAVADWQSLGVDDEPIAGSDNLVKSKSLYKVSNDLNVLAGDNIPFCKGTIAGIVYGNIYFKEADNRLLVDLPINAAIPNILFKNKDYQRIWVVYSGSLPTDVYRAVTPISWNSSNVPVQEIVNNTTTFTPERIAIIIKKKTNLL